ncbi:UNVERIFIED_ORG: hypothetical protein GGD51_000868 [Rhizobium esperanzae]
MQRSAKKPEYSPVAGSRVTCRYHSVVWARAAVAKRPPIRASAGSARKADVINFESIGHCSFAVREARGSACRHAVFLAQWTGAWRKGLKCLKIRTEADLKSIAKRLKTFEAAVRTDNHLAMSEANKEFHMAIAHAGKNQYLASSYEKLLSQGQRLLHLHFEYLERTQEGYLLTDEHTLMLDAIRDKNVDLADELAHAHTRQFQDNFINFMRENYTTDVALGPLRAAE